MANREPSSLVTSMWPSMQDWISAVYIIVPIYCTNGAPVVFGGGRPIDFGKSLRDGERIFGDHKTIRGFASGVIVGIIVALFEGHFFSGNLFPVAILASLGALLGDLGGAFFKRRLGIMPGRALPGLDQLDFVAGAVLASSAVIEISLGSLLILFLVTPPIHFLTNLGAYVLRLKSTYW
jgi:CDP-2,3-bis-(O-geranylgeranyl)-sn-glycerol synthase